ncbi:MAG: DUF262 domain-containing protein [Methylotenera sp.]|nr:DUF262 domain-containing protein [Methylotenera sp.]
MIRYQVRSKELIDLVNEIKSRRLIMSPYFQRHLVWRLVHKVDFIKTILMGLPFPQIFIAKGSIDLESMTTTSCIVDGQQRMSAIVDFVSGVFKVDNKAFKELALEKQEEFLKYQIPIIDLDLYNDAPEIKEIFQRLNRTFYALNAIEKLSTEYASSEFMLFAKHITGELKLQNEDDEDDSNLSLDPTIPTEFIAWAKDIDAPNFKKLIIESNVFTPYEISRQIHLMYALNLIATYIGGIYTRNDLVTTYLDDFKDSLVDKDAILDRFEITSKIILALNLPSNSYWFNKANMFTLFSFIAQETASQLPVDMKERLTSFENETPLDYKIAAKEGVNNMKERKTRQAYLESLLR